MATHKSWKPSADGSWTSVVVVAPNSGSSRPTMFSPYRLLDQFRPSHLLPLQASAPSNGPDNMECQNESQTTSSTYCATIEDDEVELKTVGTPLVPITYYPLATQRRLGELSRLINQKPYAHYLNKDMHITAEALEALKSPMDAKEMLSLECAHQLLLQGDHKVENGWCAIPGGGAYIASRTYFPGRSGGAVTGDMIDWWFWWHSVEPERYALWFPYCHIEARPEFSSARLARSDLSHQEKWLNSTHSVTEYIGSRKVKVRIQFVDPGTFGLPWEHLRVVGYEAAVCAVLWDSKLPIKIGNFIHLWRRRPEGQGLELRSRYWIGNEVYLDLFGWRISLDYVGSLFGRKQKRFGEGLAYEQFLHDQTEFTNLHGMLAGLYDDFGKAS